jgi:hypothetical protein
MTYLETLLREAARIGADAKREVEALDKQAATSRARASAAAQAAEQDRREAGGFNAPRFRALTEVARVWGAHTNDPYSSEATKAAEVMTNAFITAFTGQTEKSRNGGKFVGYVHAVKLGANAERARQALHGRILHWQAIHDKAPEGEKPADRAARQAEARRYTVVCGLAPDVEGGSIATARDGSTNVPKFNGRPARVVRGVEIDFARATNRDSQFAEFARLFAKYGDVVLHSDVVDAFLDNGGRFKPDCEGTVESACGAALAALDSILALGGRGTADEASILAAHYVVERIMKEGFKASTKADYTPEADAPEADAPEADAPEADAPEADTPEADAPEADAPEADAPEAEAVLAGLGGAPEADAPEGEGVTLGTPVEPKVTTRRPRRHKAA